MSSSLQNAAETSRLRLAATLDPGEELLAGNCFSFPDVGLQSSVPNQF